MGNVQVNGKTVNFERACSQMNNILKNWLFEQPCSPPFHHDGAEQRFVNEYAKHHKEEFNNIFTVD